jgi:hypothetical protein
MMATRATAIVTCALVVAGCGSDGLSGATHDRAQAACRQFLADADPYLFGVGVDQLVDQARGLGVARARLAAALREAGESDSERQDLSSLADTLVADNRLLDETQRIAEALVQSRGDPSDPSLRQVLQKFDRATHREDRRASELDLTACTRPT